MNVGESVRIGHTAISSILSNQVTTQPFWTHFRQSGWCKQLAAHADAKGCSNLHPAKISKQCTAHVSTLRLQTVVYTLQTSIERYEKTHVKSNAFALCNWRCLSVSWFGDPLFISHLHFEYLSYSGTQELVLEVLLDRSSRQFKYMCIQFLKALSMRPSVQHWCFGNSLACQQCHGQPGCCTPNLGAVKFFWWCDTL